MIKKKLLETQYSTLEQELKRKIFLVRQELISQNLIHDGDEQGYESKVTYEFFDLIHPEEVCIECMYDDYSDDFPSDTTKVQTLQVVIFFKNYLREHKKSVNDKERLTVCSQDLIEEQVEVTIFSLACNLGVTNISEINFQLSELTEDEKISILRKKVMNRTYRVVHSLQDDKHNFGQDNYIIRKIFEQKPSRIEVQHLYYRGIFIDIFFERRVKEQYVSNDSIDFHETSQDHSDHTRIYNDCLILWGDVFVQTVCTFDDEISVEAAKLIELDEVMNWEFNVTQEVLEEIDNANIISVEQTSWVMNATRLELIAESSSKAELNVFFSLPSFWKDYFENTFDTCFDNHESNISVEGKDATRNTQYFLTEVCDFIRLNQYKRKLEDLGYAANVNCIFENFNVWSSNWSYAKTKLSGLSYSVTQCVYEVKGSTQILFETKSRLMKPKSARINEEPDRTYSIVLDFDYILEWDLLLSPKAKDICYKIELCLSDEEMREIFSYLFSLGIDDVSKLKATATYEGAIYRGIIG